MFVILFFLLFFITLHKTQTLISTNIYNDDVTTGWSGNPLPNAVTATFGCTQIPLGTKYHGAFGGAIEQFQQSFQCPKRSNVIVTYTEGFSCGTNVFTQDYIALWVNNVELFKRGINNATVSPSHYECKVENHAKCNDNTFYMSEVVTNIGIFNEMESFEVQWKLRTSETSEELVVVYISIECDVIPTNTPTVIPTKFTKYPTKIPTIYPTKYPTLIPTTNQPSLIPTKYPTKYPTTNIPTNIPSLIPTQMPSFTLNPTIIPTVIPTNMPTNIPTNIPTDIPTVVPTIIPTINPTLIPTLIPTIMPTIKTTLIITTNKTENGKILFFLNERIIILFIIILIAVICVICLFFVIIYLKRKNKKMKTQLQSVGKISLQSESNQNNNKNIYGNGSQIILVQSNSHHNINNVNVNDSYPEPKLNNNALTPGYGDIIEDDVYSTGTQQQQQNVIVTTKDHDTIGNETFGNNKGEQNFDIDDSDDNENNGIHTPQNSEGNINV